VELSDGKIFTQDVVVKLAHYEEEQEYLLHEFSIYQHLSIKGVEGVAEIFGLFKDAEEGGPLALVMSHAGVSLRDRKEPVSSSECAAFLSTLEAIHDAGVIHRDPRPRNLLVDDEGEVTIINFDQAEVKAYDKEMDHEYDGLFDLLQSLMKGKGSKDS